MKRLRVGSIAALLIAVSYTICDHTVAWSQGVAKAAFEVASVRASPPGSDGLTSIGPMGGARFTARNATLPMLLQMAYGVNTYQIEPPGKTPWFDSAQYDITATTEHEAVLTYETLKPMLQTLLADRLHLVMHRVTKSVKGYALVLGDGQPKLVISQDPSTSAYILRDRMVAPKASADLVASMLALVVEKPVSNQTGLKGDYSIKLSFAPADAEDSTQPSVFTAVREQLGLKLVAQEVPVEMLVVDHVDRVPTEN